MNNAKMWLVVNPTVGIPVFLGAVAVGSFAVHVAVLSNTTWVADFLAGRELGSSASIEAPALASAEDAKVYFESSATGADSATVVLPDGRTAEVVFKEPQQLAALSQ